MAIDEQNKDLKPKQFEFFNTKTDVKDIRKLAEEAKIAVRSIRRDAIDEAKELEKKSEITEDDLKKEEEDIQKLTDKKVEEIDMLLEKKEKEIMSI